VEAGVAADDDAADDVGVAADVLGGAVNDEVGAELERALEIGDMKVLSTASRTPRRGSIAAIARMSAILSIGLVGVSIQTSLVSGRIAASTLPGSVKST
jgi:hypothetical protein